MKLEAAAYTVPTPGPEADGTFAWSSATAVVVHARAQGRTGLGWTYGPAPAAAIVDDLLAPAVDGADPMDLPAAALRMRRVARNAPLPGLVTFAVSAVDVALWDLKARILGVPLHALLGRARETVPVYGSGGFTTLSAEQTREQLAGWVRDDGIPRVKIKTGEVGKGSGSEQGFGEVERTRVGPGALPPPGPLRGLPAGVLHARHCHDRGATQQHQGGDHDEKALFAVHPPAPGVLDVCAHRYLADGRSRWPYLIYPAGLGFTPALPR